MNKFFVLLSVVNVIAAHEVVASDDPHSPRLSSHSVDFNEFTSAPGGALFVMRSGSISSSSAGSSTDLGADQDFDALIDSAAAAAIAETAAPVVEAAAAAQAEEERKSEESAEAAAQAEEERKSEEAAEAAIIQADAAAKEAAADPVSTALAISPRVNALNQVAFALSANDVSAVLDALQRLRPLLNQQNHNVLTADVLLSKYKMSVHSRLKESKIPELMKMLIIISKLEKSFESNRNSNIAEKLILRKIIDDIKKDQSPFWKGIFKLRR